MGWFRCRCSDWLAKRVQALGIFRNYYPCQAYRPACRLHRPHRPTENGLGRPRPLFTPARPGPAYEPIGAYRPAWPIGNTDWACPLLFQEYTSVALACVVDHRVSAEPLSKEDDEVPQWLFIFTHRAHYVDQGELVGGIE